MWFTNKNADDFTMYFYKMFIYSWQMKNGTIQIWQCYGINGYNEKWKIQDNFHRNRFFSVQLKNIFYIESNNLQFSNNYKRTISFVHYMVTIGTMELNKESWQFRRNKLLKASLACIQCSCIHSEIIINWSCIIQKRRLITTKFEISSKYSELLEPSECERVNFERSLSQTV